MQLTIIIILRYQIPLHSFWLLLLPNQKWSQWNVKTQVTFSTKSVCCVSLWYRVNTCFSKTNKTFTTQHFIMACLSFCPAVIWIENSFLCNTSRGCGLLWVPPPPPNPVSTAPHSRPCNPQKFFLCLPPQLIYGLDSIFCMDSLIASQFSSKLNQFSHSSRPRLELDQALVVL